MAVYGFCSYFYGIDELWPVFDINCCDHHNPRQYQCRSLSYLQNGLVVEIGQLEKLRELLPAQMFDQLVVVRVTLLDQCKQCVQVFGQIVFVVVEGG